MKVTAKKTAIAAMAATVTASALVSTSAYAAQPQDEAQTPPANTQAATTVQADSAAPSQAVAAAEAAATSAPALAATLTPAELKATKQAQRAARIQTFRAKLVKIARKQVGDNYTSGGTGPNAFDCSGFTQYVYRTADGKYLPHQSYAQYRKAKKVSLKSAKPGDLVFYFKGGVHHVGLYIGHKTMIHAANSHTGVQRHKIFGAWYSSHFSGLGRVLPA